MCQTFQFASFDIDATKRLSTPLNKLSHLTFVAQLCLLFHKVTLIIFLIQIVLMACFVAATQASVAPLAVSAPIVAAPAVAARLEEFDPLPQYKFGYDVADSLTGDYKSQQESRDGDVVSGQYSLVESDGTRRIVDYSADPINGFNAVVRNEPLVAAAPVVAEPVVAAPVAKYSAAYTSPVAYAAYTSPVARFAPYTAPAYPPVASPLAYKYASAPFIAV